MRRFCADVSFQLPWVTTGCARAGSPGESTLSFLRIVAHFSQLNTMHAVFASFIALCPAVVPQQKGGGRKERLWAHTAGPPAGPRLCPAQAAPSSRRALPGSLPSTSPPCESQAVRWVPWAPCSSSTQSSRPPHLMRRALASASLSALRAPCTQGSRFWGHVLATSLCCHLAPCPAREGRNRITSVSFSLG